MQKLLFAGLSILLLLALCGCSSNAVSNLTGEGNETESTDTVSAEGVDVQGENYSITESGTYRVPNDIKAGSYHVVVSGNVTFEVIHSEENTVGMQSEKIDQTSDMDATTYAMDLSDGTELEVVLGTDGSMELEPYSISE